MPIPPVPVTPVNHIKSIDDKLTTIEADLAAIAIGTTGSLLAGVEFDEVAITRNPDGTIDVVEYLLATVLQATLTCSYDVDAQLAGVVRS